MAPAIPVDAETYAFLSGFAKARGQTLGEAVRTLADLEVRQGSEGIRAIRPKQSRPNGRKPKTRLDALKKTGVLKDGQTVYLYDFRGQRVEGGEATIRGERLVFENKRYSMSRLAALLLQNEGYKADNVRGPAHWYTVEGISLMELWEKYLKSEDD